jgi:hypothetical protein
LDRGLFNPIIEIVIATKLVLQLIKVTPFVQNLVGHVQTSGHMPLPDTSEFVAEKTIELINSEEGKADRIAGMLTADRWTHGYQRQTGDGVAYMAHISGLIFGMASARLFESGQRRARQGI